MLFSNHGIVQSKIGLQAPTGLDVTLNTNTSYIDATWNASANATEYQYRYQVNGGSWSSAVSVGFNLSFSAVGPFTAGQEICVAVKALSIDEETNWTTVDCVTIPNPPSPPDPLDAWEASYQRLTAQWASVSGALEYAYSIDEGSGYGSDISTGTTNYFTNLRIFFTPKTVCVRAKVRTAGGWSNWCTPDCVNMS